MGSRHRTVALILLGLCSIIAGCHATRSGDWQERLQRPSPEFSLMPFWFWNDHLSDDEIKRQMADFREHGVYGFVIHGRMGLPREIPYLGERWLHYVRTAVEEAARTDMRVCLYDEGMYPSGSAHGQVVQSNPAFAAKGLAVDCQDVDGPGNMPVPELKEGERVVTIVGRLIGDGKALEPASLRVLDPAARQIELSAGRWRLMVFACVPSGGRIRGVHEGEEDNQPRAPAAADLLNPEAMQAFLRLGYEPYRTVVGRHFGRTVIGMFTDEPSMLGRRPRRGLKPWSAGLAASFERKHGYALLPWLPALFFDVGERTASIRNDYESALADRLEETYYQPLSRWCERHGIALTGHPAGATEIDPLRYFQFPGQDIVWRGVVPGKGTTLEGTNSAIAKCSSSVARHDGRRRNSNEVYGAFGWQLTMEEMKWLADWLMVRGVNLLYPHAFYYSIRGDRGQERPPDVGPNNAWWPHYRPFADYTARLCGLMTDSRQVCEVAVLGSNHRLPWRAAKFLYQRQVDFNYLEEYRLLEQARVEGSRLRVGPMAYTLLIVDQDEPVPAPVAGKLRAFEAAGGKVRYCRGEPSTELIEGLARDVTLDPSAADLRCAHVVKDGIHFYLLVNEGEQRIDTRVTVRCRGRSFWFDAWEGRFRDAPAVVENQALSATLSLDRRESRLLCVDPSREPLIGATASPRWACRLQANLAGPWTAEDATGRKVLDGLGDWLKQPTATGYTGTLRYRTEFPFNKAQGTQYDLDLGGVGDFASVSLNGRMLPVRFWAPYRWDVTEYLREGPNELIAGVTNSLVNQYDLRIRLASGLLGPVQILACRPEERPMSQSTASQPQSRAATSRPSSGRSVCVAAIQMLPSTGDPKANIERAELLVRRAVRDHAARVIVFPECTLTGYTNPADGKMSLAESRNLAETVPGPSVNHFAALAHELGVYIVWGLHERRGDKYYNSAVLLSPEGKVLGTYSKVHINKYESQMGWTNGDQFHVWSCRLGETAFRIGIMICYDREVPEAARSLAMLGADMILVPQATACTALYPIHRDQLRVRAFENEVYLAMANWGGPVFKGHSMIMAPTGDVLRLGSQDEEILTATVDLAALQRLREGGIYGRHHRQPAAYAPLLLAQPPE